MHSRAVLVAVFALASGLGVVWGDTVTLKDKTVVEGKVLDDSPERVVINPYNSTQRKMEYGVQTFLRPLVAKVEITPPDPMRDYWEKAHVANPDHKALLQYCAEHYYTAEAREHAARVLIADPKHAEARRVLGDAEADALIKSHPAHNAELRGKIPGYGALEPEQRKATYEQWKKDHGVTLPQHFFDRVVRSLQQPKGLQEDLRMSYNTRKISGKYTLWVPEDYDPYRAYPLLVALHGTDNGYGALGNGPDFMKHFQADGKKFGWIIVCPTAEPLPWNSRGDQFVLSIINEIELLYNIDLNRVSLIGHSRGGMGTWYFGTGYPDLFSAIAPAAGNGGGGAPRCVSSGTGMYIYHSSDDPQVAHGDDRSTATLLMKGRADFIYTEYKDAAHGWPREVVDDQLLYLRRHHRMTKTAKNTFEPLHGTRSSFLEPKDAWAEEWVYYPAEPDGEMTLPKLLAWLEMGGAKADKAAKEIIRTADKAAVAPLAKLLANHKAADESRAVAARVLGSFKEPAAASALSKALTDKNLKVVRFVAEALGQAGTATDSGALVMRLEDLAKDFEKAAKREMSNQDWEDTHLANAAIVVALCTLADFRSPGPVSAIGIKRVLLVEKLPRFAPNYDPEVVRRKAGVMILRALPGLKLKAEFDLIKTKWGSDKDIGRAAAETGPKFQ